MEFPIYTLHLAKSFVYTSESPTDTADAARAPSEKIPEPRLEDEAGETLTVFSASSIVEKGGVPEFAHAANATLFSGIRAAGAESRRDEHRFTLEAGDYCFSQWRASQVKELESGLTEFLRQAWWEGLKAEGPLYLRLLREDGNLAFQALRRLARSSGGGS